MFENKPKIFGEGLRALSEISCTDWFNFSFEKLNADKVKEAFMTGNYNVKMDYNEVIQLAELQSSPFKDRICRVSVVYHNSAVYHILNTFILNIHDLLSCHQPRGNICALCIKIVKLIDSQPRELKLF